MTRFRAKRLRFLTMKIILLTLAVIFFALIAGGVYLIPKLTKITPHVWKTVQLDQGDMLIVATATGSVEPTATVKVGSLVSGKVKEVPVEQDQLVKKGEVLAVLDTELLENERKDKEILLRQARSNLMSLEIETIQLDIKEERLKQSVARDTVTVARTKATCELAQKTLDRYREMVKKNATSISEYEIKMLEKENAERDCQIKEIETRSLDTDLKEISASRKAVAAKVQQTELSIEQAAEALKKAITNVGYAQILSPIDGVVLERTVDVGQTLASQFQAPDLFKIAADLRHVNINASIDEVDISRIRIGQTVRFDVDAYRGDKFSGKVKTIHLKFDGKSNLVSYPVVIEAENPPVEASGSTTADKTPQPALGPAMGKLLPGMTAFLEFDVDQKKNIARIPVAALSYTPPPDVLALIALRDATNAAPVKKPEADEKDAAKVKLKGSPATVYVKDNKGNPKAVKLRVGETDGKFYELLSSELKAGDEVITGE